MNVHSRKVEIAPGLALLGVGGSVPSFKDGKLFWEGFPYSSDKLFGEAVAKLLDPIIEDENTPPGESYILMTHNGPNKSSKNCSVLFETRPLFLNITSQVPQLNTILFLVLP